MAQKYRKIDPRIWRDEKFRRLTPIRKLIAMYCLTAQVNRCGIFAFSTAAAAQETGLPQKQFDTEFSAVVEAMGWRWDADSWVLYLPRWWKYNAPESHKTMKGCLTDLADLPATDLIDEFAVNTQYLTGTVRDTLTGFFVRVSDTLAEGYPKGIDGNSEGYGISGSGSGSGSGAGAGAGAGAGGPDPRSVEDGGGDPFAEFDPEDPLRAREKMRKEFEREWNAAGLQPLARLTHGLWTRLEGLMRVPEWRGIWRDALRRAGQCPVLVSGGGKRGPMDPRQFLADDDFAASILRGMFDPREAKPVGEEKPKLVVVADPFAALAEKHRREAQTA